MFLCFLPVLSGDEVVFLICRVSANTITVWEMIDGNRIQLIAFTDPMGLICGRVGIDASGDGIGFDRFSVRQADE